MPEAISIVGLGRLGAPMAACLAHKGLRVIGVDSSPAKVAALARREPPVHEPGLAEVLANAPGEITATMDLHEAVRDSGVTFIVVATPSDPGGGFSLSQVLPVCEGVGRALREKASYHLVVLTSTVMPGATGGQVRPLLEDRSGKTCGRELGLCYNPEFIALGSVVRDFLNPDFVLVGESDRRAGDLLEALYRRVLDRHSPLARMSWVNAELAKLAVNTYVTTKITFANMLARICERLDGADVDVVTSALGLDSRIGKKYLKGAIGYGGPCFPRDNLALAALARGIGAPADLAEATDRTNRGEVERLAERVLQRLPRDGTVGVLGLSYKPDTDVVEESQGLLLSLRLASAGIPVVAFDPLANESAQRAAPGAFQLAPTLEECARRADLLVLATPWPQLKELEVLLSRPASRRVAVIDCWRQLDPVLLSGVAEYLPLGIGSGAPRARREEK
ncbi:MAG: UDP-glucose/GDP-mannose dehydrogenase family protein [Myxococcales bacterium]|nr:UDP-glucose/GDP-mannose dehydrogenase family protein [Myxococcales bacterium]